MVCINIIYFRKNKVLHKSFNIKVLTTFTIVDGLLKKKLK